MANSNPNNRGGKTRRKVVWRRGGYIVHEIHEGLFRAMRQRFSMMGWDMIGQAGTRAEAIEIIEGVTA